jgi:hypothetical protein
VANRLQYLLQAQADSFYNKESYVQEVFQVLESQKTFFFIFFFYVCNLLVFVISQSICPWQAFPAKFE